MLKRLTILILFFVATGCSNSGQVERFKGTPMLPESEFLYRYAFVSGQQPESITLFSTRETRRYFISDLLIKKGYLVGNVPMSITTHKAINKRETLIVECGLSKAGIYGLLRKRDGGNGQTITCGAYDMFDGEKVYEGVADIVPDAFSSVDLMSDQGIRIALSELNQIGEGHGRQITEAESFALIRAR